MTTDKNTLLAERDRRVELLHRIMAEEGATAAFFTGTAMQTCQLPIKFFSNYTLNTRRSFIFCAQGELPCLVVPTPGQQYHARIASWLPEENVQCCPDYSCIAKHLAGHKRVVWYKPNEYPIDLYGILMSMGIEFVDITEKFTLARANKSEYEIQLTKDASKLAADSLAHILPLFKDGVTEEDIIGAGEGYLRANGASDSLVLTRACKPHSFITRAQARKVNTADGVFVYSAEVAGRGGYWTQLVRPIFMSEDAQPEARAILEVSKEAEAEGLKYLRPGYRLCDVCSALEGVVIARGYKTGVWCGHGMGPDLGDAVDIGVSNTMEIVPNMIITLHPSIVSENDGLLYGNTFLTTEGDPINLTDYFSGSPVLADMLKEI